MRLLKKKSFSADNRNSPWAKCSMNRIVSQNQSINILSAFPFFYVLKVV